MAKRIIESGGDKVSAKGTKTKTAKPKKLSKTAQWWIDNPEGIGVTYIDMRAVLK